MKEQKHAAEPRRGKPASKKARERAREPAHLSAAVRKRIWLASLGMASVFVFFAAAALVWLLPDDIGTDPEQENVAGGVAPDASVVASIQPFDWDQPPEAIQSLIGNSAVSASNRVGVDTYQAEVDDFKITYRSGVVDRTLFDEGKQRGVSDPVLLQLSEIFGWDIDFAVDMHEGDHYLVVYEDRYRLGEKVSTTILAAQFVNRGKAYRAIGFPLDDGRVAYFTPTGKRLRRAFLRAPVSLSSVSSPFSKSRYHPVLNMWRAHTGVDYSAAPGAPVRATANGRVVSAGWNGGYGRTVVLKHAGAYSTLYAHLSRYRPGLAVGDHVAQGEVIGYVGQSGLATAPHLHYEFRVNGEHRDPLTAGPHQAEGEIIAPKFRDEFFRIARTRNVRLDILTGRQVALQ